MSCYIFDTKMEDCETLRSPEGEETGNSRQDIFYPPHPSSVCSLFFKKPFKSHMGKEALQGAFDSFWFWLRQWNYWENPTFYRILLLKGLLSGLKTIKSLFVGQYRAEEKNKNNCWTGADSVGLHRVAFQCQNVASKASFTEVTFFILRDQVMH